MKNLKSFGITLAVSLVILAVAALFACGFVADTVCGIFSDGGKDLDQILSPGETTGTSEKDERFTKELNGESFTWLWVVSDYRPDTFDNYYPSKSSQIKDMKDFGILGADYRFVEATSIVLIHADVDKRDYIIMTIPAMTQVDTPAGQTTLGRVYNYYGIEGLCEKVSSMTGLNIEDYSVIHSTDLYKVANAVGSVPMTMPVDIYTDGKNYISAPEKNDDTTDSDAADDKKQDKDTSDADDTDGEEEVKLEIELEKASSVKLAKKLQAALLYYDPSDGIDDEMKILQSFANGVFQNISSFSDSELQGALDSLSGAFVSNSVTGEDAVLCGETVRAYTWLEIKTVTYPGKLVGQRGDNAAYYNPDISDGMEYFYDYR